MTKLSVIIPSRNERFLPQTIADVLAKARGDVEVIAVLDGYWPEPPIPDDKRLHIIHHSTAQGMRASINHAAVIAQGEFYMKCDAHCMFAEGFDLALASDCDKDWIAIPSRYSLDAKNWAILNTGKSRVDYHYLDYPFPLDRDDGAGLHGIPWNERARERKDKPEFDIDDEMSFQGSCWFMSSHHFHNFLHGMDSTGYGGFSQEPQEIGMKTWLGGGRIVTNKKTWYAHLHKGKQYGRGYSQNRDEIRNGHRYSARYWMTDQWADRIHDIDWLIEKFWPVPKWPDDWRLHKNDGQGL